MSASGEATVIYGSGTIVGLVNDTKPKQSRRAEQQTSFEIPEIVITGSSTNSLNKNPPPPPPHPSIDNYNNDDGHENENEVYEGTSLLGGDSKNLIKTNKINKTSENSENGGDGEPSNNDEEFEQFIMNRTLSENNMLDSSIYSELQFPPSLCGDSTSSCSGHVHSNANAHQIYSINDGGSRLAIDLMSRGQLPAPQVSPNTLLQQQHQQHHHLQSSNPNVADVLNSSMCSRESRQMRRTRRKLKAKTKSSCNTSSEGSRLGVVNYPPRYTAIFMDSNGNAPNATMMSQIANAAATSPFLTSATSDGQQPQFVTSPEFPYYQQRPLLAMGQTSRSFEGNPTIAPAGGAAVAAGLVVAPRFNICKWFSRPSLPFIIGIFALGGVACTLGGIVLGSTGLIEHSTQYLSAALLMIGIGVSLLVIAGAIWRISLPDDLDNCHCYRHMETCVNCNNPYCYNRMFGNGHFYPEFQYRTPPPSYLTSLNEYAAMSFLFHQNTSTQRAPDTMRINTPPPMYRSTNSLSVCPALPQAPSAAGQSSTSSIGFSRNALFKQSSTTLAPVAENLPSDLAQQQMQPLTKDFNYLELD